MSVARSCYDAHRGRRRARWQGLHGSEATQRRADEEGGQRSLQEVILHQLLGSFGRHPLRCGVWRRGGAGGHEGAPAPILFIAASHIACPPHSWLCAQARATEAEEGPCRSSVLRGSPTRVGCKLYDMCHARRAGAPDARRARARSLYMRGVEGRLSSEACACCWWRSRKDRGYRVSRSPGGAKYGHQGSVSLLNITQTHFVHRVGAKYGHKGSVSLLNTFTVCTQTHFVHRAFSTGHRRTAVYRTPTHTVGILKNSKQITNISILMFLIQYSHLFSLSRMPYR